MTYIQAKSLIQFIQSLMCVEEREHRSGTITITHEFITGEKGSMTIPVCDGPTVIKIPVPR